MSMTKTILNQDILVAHFRMGWEPSPDNFQLVRYHAVSVDYSRISTEARMHKFIEELSKIGPIKIIRQPRKGKVKGSSLEYMFQSFDSNLGPIEINFNKLSRKIIKDYNFCERLVGNIEDYVERIYSG